MSDAVVGSLDRPETNLMNNTRSSLENDSNVDHNHVTRGSVGSTSRYLTSAHKKTANEKGMGSITVEDSDFFFVPPS